MPKVVLFFIFFFCAIICDIFAQGTCRDEYKKYVYHINSTCNCTGFQVQGYQGIITALHCVLGSLRGDDILVTDHNDFDPVKIKRADINNDVALISSKNMLKLANEGFRTNDSLPPHNATISVIGHPHSMKEPLDSKIHLRDNPLIELRDILPKKEISREWVNPSLYSKMLNIEGHLAPGHSGAPILNENCEVIGVANGGINEGKDEICWGIPWKNISLEDRDDIKDELIEAAGRDSSFLYCSDDTEPSLLCVMDESGNKCKVSISEQVSITKENYIKPFKKIIAPPKGYQFIRYEWIGPQRDINAKNIKHSMKPNQKEIILEFTLFASPNIDGRLEGEIIADIKKSDRSKEN